MKRRERDTPANAGLTLLEAVLALGLMGLILSALLAVSSSGLGAWLDTRKTLSDIRREANWTNELRSSLAAMVPLVVANTPSSRGQSVFFQGGPRAMRFVSAHSPAFRGRGGIRLVSLLASSDGQGIALELTDSPCPDPRRLGQILAAPVHGLRPNKSFSIHPDHLGQTVSTVVLENVTECRFQYLYRPALAGVEPRWVSHWSAPGAIPQAVRVEWSVGHQDGPAVLAASVVAARASTELVSEPRQAERHSYAFD